jgi:hypothetical protein
MIGFVVPVKPRSLSKDWAYDNLLLERTARSICAQTDQAFRLVIVYNDVPQINFTHPNIIFLHYPFPAVEVHEIEDLDYVRKHYPDNYAVRMLDKGKKIHYGCRKCIEEGSDYIMGVDSDDLVSNRLADFVNREGSPEKPGWRINKGYMHEENSRMLVKSNELQDINGSTHIIRKDLITIPDFSTNVFWNYNLFEAHGYTRARIKDYHGELLEDYPSFGVIYMIHRNNYSSVLQLTTRRTFKNVIKKIVRGKLVSATIRNEFHLYKLPSTTATADSISASERKDVA